MEKGTKMDYEALSKEISYALRHAPWEYELELDAEGWVDVRQLLDALKESERWAGINAGDLLLMIEQSDKKRHELFNGRIRALYGHSIPQKITREPRQPPEILYHGTARRFLPSIQEAGLLPRNRQYVHLSVDEETALQVGRRRDKNPALLAVRAAEAWNAGVAFYLGNEKVWLADKVPAAYIEFP
jgi:putative RNA 2'-phosphotransferase